MNNTYILGNTYYTIFKDKMVEVLLYSIRNWIADNDDRLAKYNFKTIKSHQAIHNGEKMVRYFETRDPEELDIYRNPEELKEKYLAKAQAKIDNL